MKLSAFGYLHRRYFVHFPLSSIIQTTKTKSGANEANNGKICVTSPIEIDNGHLAMTSYSGES